MDSLAQNPSGGSGIYGQPKQPNDTLEIVNQLKDREMNDFKQKAAFMSDLSLRQDRLKQVFDPQNNQQQQQPMNTVAAADPNVMTGYQKGELGVRQQEANTESQRLAQTGKLGQEAQDTKIAQEKLNQQKSDQINVEKQKELQSKTDEANKKLELAQQALNDKTKTAEEQLQSHKDLAAAMEERHKLELAQKDFQFQTASAQHAQQIKDMEQKIKDSANSTTTTELDASGNKKTVTTQKGSSSNAPVKNADGTYTVTKNGQTGIIPADKLDDWMANYHEGDAP